MTDESPAHDWHLVSASSGGRGDMLALCSCGWNEYVLFVPGMRHGEAAERAETLGRNHAAGPSGG